MDNALSKQSKITSKYQVTVPKAVRERLKLGAADVLTWQVAEDGRIYVTAAEAPITELKGVIRVGHGDIAADLEKARDAMVERFR
jgi:AbrB family looped-hinge helix DNA binding protein